MVCISIGPKLSSSLFPFENGAVKNPPTKMNNEEKTSHTRFLVHLGHDVFSSSKIIILVGVFGF